MRACVHACACVRVCACIHKNSEIIYSNPEIKINIVVVNVVLEKGSDEFAIGSCYDLHFNQGI